MRNKTKQNGRNDKEREANKTEEEKKQRRTIKIK